MPQQVWFWKKKNTSIGHFPYVVLSLKKVTALVTATFTLRNRVIMATETDILNYGVTANIVSANMSELYCLD